MQKLNKGPNPLTTLEKGKTLKLGLNRVVDFKIVTAGGTVIEGKIPANEYLSITNGGDIQSADITINDLPRDLTVSD